MKVSGANQRPNWRVVGGCCLQAWVVMVVKIAKCSQSWRNRKINKLVSLRTATERKKITGLLQEKI